MLRLKEAEKMLNKRSSEVDEEVQNYSSCKVNRNKNRTDEMIPNETYVMECQQPFRVLFGNQ